MRWDGTFIELFRVSKDREFLKRIQVYLPYYSVGRKLNYLEDPLSPCNLKIEDPTISRVHLTIIRQSNLEDSNDYFVKDGGLLSKRSLRGIFDKKGNRIIYKELKPIDFILFGNFELVFVQGRDKVPSAKSTF